MQEPFVLASAAGGLVFGMDWFPLIHGRAEGLARRIARRHRATHMVLTSNVAPVVGIATLKPTGGHQKRQLWSAAASAARLFPEGTVVFTVVLPNGWNWLLALHEGAVVARTDKLYQDRDRLQAVIEELRQAYPGLRVLNDTERHAAPTLADLEAGTRPDVRLQRLRMPVFGLSSPPRVLLVAFLLLLGLVRLPDLLSQDASGRADPEAPSADQAWRAAIDTELEKHVLHGPQGTQSLLENLLGLPAGLAGWELRQAVCRSHADQWHCEANYERLGRNADNAGLLAAAPASWAFEFPSMDLARALWRSSGPSIPLADLALHGPEHTERHLFSALQAMKPAFTHILVGQPSPLPVPAPLDASGQPMARPAELPVHLSRNVRIDGPLRSAALLPPLSKPFAWRRAELSLREAPAPSLLSSRLSLSLEGVLYEVQEPGSLHDHAAHAHH